MNMDIDEHSSLITRDRNTNPDTTADAADAQEQEQDQHHIQIRSDDVDHGAIHSARKLKDRNRWIARVIVGIIAICLFFVPLFFIFMGNTYTSAPGALIDYKFTAESSANIGSSALFTMQSKTLAHLVLGQNTSVYYSVASDALSKSPPSSYTAVPLVPLANSPYLVAILPEQKINMYINFHLKLTDERDLKNPVIVPPTDLNIKFQDEIPPGLISIHIAVCISGAVAILHCLMYAIVTLLTSSIDLPKYEEKPFKRLMIWLLITWVLLFIAFIPIGMGVSYTAYSIPWSGWPFGTDSTDTKSEALLIVLLIIVLLRIDVVYKKDAYKSMTAKIGPKMMAFIVILGIIGTGVAFGIPHS